MIDRICLIYIQLTPTVVIIEGTQDRTILSISIELTEEVNLIEVVNTIELSNKDTKELVIDNKDARS
jgi:hypothetical protein